MNTDRIALRPRTRALIAALGMIVLSACSRLEYVKVPTPTQYAVWNDELQKKADSMKGVRYYLPRPFLVLKQSTPVAQRTALVSFHWDASSGAYLLDLPAANTHWVAKIAPTKLSITQALASTLSTRAPAVVGGAARGSNQGATSEAAADAGTAAANAAAGSLTGPNTAPAAPSTPSELHASTGYINGTDPVTRLGDRFDIVYLPDFEEQYVIQPHAGLGKAEIETRLRNGWAAETFSQSVDNSKLIPYVIDQVSKASTAAANIFTTWAPLAAGLPPGSTVPLQALATKGGQQGALSGEEITSAHKLLGEVLVFKIAEVRIAQPGLYPILKPREIRQWLGTQAPSGTDPDLVFDTFVISANTPWVRPDVTFIPCPPFTMVGFNTTTEVFLSPATERIDVASGGNGQTLRNGGDEAGNEIRPAQALTGLRELLFGSSNPATQELWNGKYSSIDLAGSDVSAADDPKFQTEVAVKLKGAPPTQADAEALMQLLVARAKANRKDLKGCQASVAAETTPQVAIIRFPDPPPTVYGALRGDS